MHPTRDEIKQRILKVLHRIGRPAGATQVEELLRGWGVELSERSIRLYLLELDQEGFTQLQSRRTGRVLTARGTAEVEKGAVLERMGFVAGQIDDLNYRMGFNLRAGAGTFMMISFWTRPNGTRCRRVVRWKHARRRAREMTLSSTSAVARFSFRKWANTTSQPRFIIR